MKNKITRRGAKKKKKQLKPGFKTRHLTMMALAGIIGAGLFVGSGTAISIAGPAVILAYILSSFVVIVAMWMLGEMAVANPDSGSFSTYADRAIGHWCGFTVGWIYWMFWTLIMGWEIYVASAIFQHWFPQFYIWHFSLALTIIFVAMNFLHVKIYGEMEFWLALIKVLFIVAFIFIGALAIVHLWPWGETRGWHYLYSGPGGFMPNGWKGVILAILSVIFTFMGAEIVTIAAAEAHQPEKEIIKTTKALILRLLFFYLGSILVIVSLIPYTEPDLTNPAAGPFKATLDYLGVPYAGAILNFVVLVAVLSCFNSSLYTASRMLFSLAARGDAPKFLKMTNSRNGNPTFSVLASSLVTFITIGLTATNKMNVYGSIMESMSTVALLFYIVIIWSHLKTREKIVASGKPHHLKIWFYPWINYLLITLITLFLVLMLFQEQYRQPVLTCTVLAFIFALIGFYVQKRQLKKEMRTKL